MLTPEPAKRFQTTRDGAASRLRNPSILARRTVNTRLSAGQGLCDPGRLARTAATGLVLLALAACGKGGDWRHVQPPSPAADNDADAGYVRPPQVKAAMRAQDGGVILSGQAEPNTRVRLLSPDGAANGGTVTGDGAWSMPTPPGGGIYGLSEDLGGRIVQGEGYVVTLPAPGRPGALLRAGGGATVLGGGEGGALRITAVDFDSAGGGVVSGFAPTGTGLRLAMDGATASGEVKADAHGRFFISAPSPLKAGPHQIRVVGGGQMAVADIAVQPPAPISGQPFHAARQANGWRVDWMTPGGGRQTSLILDP